MSRNKTSKSAMPLAKSTFVVFGIDENGKTKGARFSGKKLELALHAATTLELEVFEAVSAEMQKLAKELPSGNIYVRGRAFLPFIKRELYQKLHVASGGLVRDRADEIAETCQTTMVDFRKQNKVVGHPKKLGKHRTRPSRLNNRRRRLVGLPLSSSGTVTDPPLPGFSYLSKF